MRRLFLSSLLLVEVSAFLSASSTVVSVKNPFLFAIPRERRTNILTLPESTTIADMATFANEHYLVTAAAQMGLVRCMSDTFAQTYSAFHSVPVRWASTVSAIECSAAGCQAPPFVLDVTHVGAFALAGACVSGIGGALWLRHLESRLGPAEGSTSLAAVKALCDCLFWGTSAISMNLFLVPLLCGHGCDASLANLQHQLPALMRVELMLFGPFNFLIFSNGDLVPLSLRPTCKAMLSFVSSIVLSLACS